MSNGSIFAGHSRACGEGEAGVLLRKLEAASMAHRLLLEIVVPSTLPADFDAYAVARHIYENPNYSAYHTLLLLRERYRALYDAIPCDVRARVLCSTLATTKLFNDWGSLDCEPDGSYDGIVAKALLETGKAALPYLIPLLEDKTAADVFGSEEATIAAMLEYRRADFAYRYAMLALGRAHYFLRKPSERDVLIGDFLNEMKPLCEPRIGRPAGVAGTIPKCKFGHLVRSRRAF